MVRVVLEGVCLVSWDLGRSRVGYEKSDWSNDLDVTRRDTEGMN